MEMFPGGFKIHPDSQRILEKIGILTPESTSQSNSRILSSQRPASSSAFRNVPGQYSGLNRNTGDVCGVHALLGSGESNCLEVLDIPAGVRPGDRLVTADGRRLDSFDSAQKFIEGPHGSVVELGFVDVVRTINISEDVELAVYKEIGRLLESDEPKFYRRDQEFDNGQDQMRFVNVVHDDIFSKISSLLHAVHQQEALLKAKQAETDRLQSAISALRQDSSRNDPEVVKQLRASIDQLEREIARLRENETIGIVVTLSASKEWNQLADMAGFEEHLRQDIAESLHVDRERIELIGIQKRGPESRWELDLNILKCAEPGERVAHDLGNELILQASDRYSGLRSRQSTAMITGARRVESHKVVELLRKRLSDVQGQLKRSGEEINKREADLMAQLKASELFAIREGQHLRGEIDSHKAKVQSLEVLVARMSKEQQDQKERQNEELNQKDLDRISQLRGAEAEVKRLRNEFETYSLKIQSLESAKTKLIQQVEDLEEKRKAAELNFLQINEALRTSERENMRLKEALEASSQREAAAQEEMLALSQRHKEVFMATEKALDNANKAIVSKKDQGETVAVLSQRLQNEMELRAEERRKHTEAIKSLQDQHVKMADTFSKERTEFLAHLKASEDSVRQLRLLADQSTRAQEEFSRQLLMERESLRNITKQKEIFEISLKECKEELEKARLSNIFLQKEMKQLVEELSSTKLRERELSVEENSWLRVEKPRLQNQISNLQAESEKLKSEISRLQQISDDKSVQKVNQMKEELRLKEVLLLRERAEKDAVLQEYLVRNDNLKQEVAQFQLAESSLRNQLEKTTQIRKEAERSNEINQEKISNLESEVRRLKQIQENLQDERTRLIETLESQQSKLRSEATYPQLVQGEANYSSIEMLSPGSYRDIGSPNFASMTDAQKIRELTARCQELSSLLNDKEVQRQQTAKDSKEVEGLKSALKEIHNQHQIKLQAISEKHDLDRQRQQQEVLSLTSRITELEHLVQEKEKERKQAVLEMQGFRSALQGR